MACVFLIRHFGRIHTIDKGHLTFIWSYGLNLCLALNFCSLIPFRRGKRKIWICFPHAPVIKLQVLYLQMCCVCCLLNLYIVLLSNLILSVTDYRLWLYKLTWHTPSDSHREHTKLTGFSANCFERLPTLCLKKIICNVKPFHRYKNDVQQISPPYMQLTIITGFFNL